MKKRLMQRRWTSRLTVSLLAAASFLASGPLRALDVIDPDGTLYTGISDSSHYNGSYTAANLFDFDMTGIPVGTFISADATEFARSGPGTSFVAFQLDRLYTNIGSLFFANRYAPIDAVATISIWSSASTPFTAADPGTSAQSVVQITNNDPSGAFWDEYPLTNSINGQYFLLRLDQSTPAGTPGSNPGGRELRLGAVLGNPPVITQVPADKTVYVGGTARFGVQYTGTAPLTFQWSHGANVLTNGAGISGADTANLVIANAALAEAGVYTLLLTNKYGAASGTTVNLTVVAAPTNSVDSTVISEGPIAYWQFNETAGSSIALDLVGSFNGTYGASSQLGVAGPESPQFPGFAANNTAVQTTAFTISSAVALPPLNLNPTNSLTLMAWIYDDASGGPQNPYTGIVYCRGGATSAGLICSSDGTQLGYQWFGSRYFFNSGLVIPTNQWTLVALVYTTNATTLYCSSTNGAVLSAVDNFSQAGQPFDATTYVGLDTDVGESARTFNGSIDDVAFFPRALSQTEINAIYSATGIIPTLQIVSQTTNVLAFLNDPIQLTASVSGSNPSYQWFKMTTPISGATNTSYTIARAGVGDTGGYYLVVTNQFGSVTSAVVNVTVSNSVVTPLGPSGAIYSVISASSEYPDPNYVATNMFDSDLTGVLVGTQLTNNDWADDGVSTALAPAFLAFQVDKSYSVNAVFYAQRKNNSGNPIDKITALSVWASQTTPFTAADPGTTPDAVVGIPDTDAGVLHRYILPATVTGRYFLIKVEQNPTVAGSNIGGNEFRLGVFTAPTSSLSFSGSSSGLTLYWTFGTLQQADSLTGPWVTATGVTSGVPVATTAAHRFYRLAP